ncbi:MAG: nucleoside deaminase, partial [Planctomycetota bacterium]|nr:nucleoside deaminase [Planctomycetota bacterium]
VSLEPCPMCAGALVLSRMGKIYYGADDPNAGACGTVFDIVQEKKLLHRVPVVKGVMGEESALLLKGFFQARRKEARKKKDPPSERPV